MLKKSTAYHPLTDGQSEVVNCCLEAYLCCFTCDKLCQWPKWISWAEFWYNTSHHSATGCSPFKALYGRDPPALLRANTRVAALPLVEQQLLERDAILDDLRIHLLRAQQRMKRYADTKCREEEFQVGDNVY